MLRVPARWWINEPPKMTLEVDDDSSDRAVPMSRDDEICFTCSEAVEVGLVIPVNRQRDISYLLDPAQLPLDVVKVLLDDGDHGHLVLRSHVLQLQERLHLIRSRK